MELLQRALLFAGLVGLGFEPDREPIGKRIELARPVGHLELRLNAI
jgi:hypothetical protein